MKILVTGATGYIGKRLIPLLIEAGHEVVACAREAARLSKIDDAYADKITVLEIDFLTEPNEEKVPRDIDAAYYLIHSMSEDAANFAKLEAQAAKNFLKHLENSNAKQIIYLGGITNSSALSPHLRSRQTVAQILQGGIIPLTAINAGIIVGSGSASFEIMRDLVEKLPIMVAPRWLNTRSQPVAVRNVLDALKGVLLKAAFYNQSFDIGGPDVLTYREMLLQFAAVRGLKRWIYIVPLMTPRLSSYWLYFVTSTSYPLAVSLVESMKTEVIAKDDRLFKLLSINALKYEEALRLAFEKIDRNQVISSWKDALISSSTNTSLLSNLSVPQEGCFIDSRIEKITQPHQQVLENIWQIGGERGWYYCTFLWKLRGFLDKIIGGVGLSRGRTNPKNIAAGDTLDCWRVLVADEKLMKLVLLAEMKLPGEAWLEFQIIKKDAAYYLEQTATFRPKGLLGRAYWYTLIPVHEFLFRGMIRNIVGFRNTEPKN
jgi:uncharacterized protein YbjT (DUF2867 family)